MLVHPNFDPVAISLGPIKVHWYGLSYLIGFTLAWALGQGGRGRRWICPWAPSARTSATAATTTSTAPRAIWARWAGPAPGAARAPASTDPAVFAPRGCAIVWPAVRGLSRGHG